MEFRKGRIQLKNGEEFSFNKEVESFDTLMREIFESSGEWYEITEQFTRSRILKSEIAAVVLAK